MKLAIFLVVVALSLHPLSVSAQEKPKSDKSKTLIFPPGAKKPLGSPAELAATPTPGAPADVAVDGAVPSKDPSAQIAANFFGLLQKGELDQAYDTLTRGSKIAERPEELKALKAKTKEAVEVFGAVLGYEIVESKPIGTRLLRRTYISLGKEFPLRWRLYFYKSENVWRLIDLRVDDRLAGMFEEADEPRVPAGK